MRGGWVCVYVAALGVGFAQARGLSALGHKKHGAHEMCERFPATASVPEACHYVLKHCATSPSLPYLRLYYCAGLDYTPEAAWAWDLRATCTLTLLLGCLLFFFSVLGAVAGDFFCPNLSSLATKLGMSDSTVGVTLLAFGNGFPDVVSTFRAMQSNAGAMALGELTGAAVFTVSVVCGTIMIFHSFRVPAYILLRDVGIYALALAVTLHFLHDGKLGLAEGVAMVALYVTFLAFVFVGDYYARDELGTDARDAERIAEQAPLLGEPLLASDDHPDGLASRWRASLDDSVDAAVWTKPPPSSPARIVAVALLPTVVCWQNRSWMQRVLAAGTAPAVFVLRMTVPLVSREEYLLHKALRRLQHDPDELGLVPSPSVLDVCEELERAHDPHLSDPAYLVQTEERMAADRLLVAMHCALIPVFVARVVGLSRHGQGWVYVMGLSVPVGTALGWLLARHLQALPGSAGPAQLQRYAGLRSFIGFCLGLCWIVVSVDEVLAILHTLGYIYGWSEAILGLTLFAMGNSLGDVVTNLSIARLGHPLMAMSACFASPLTNLLMGLGLATTWMQLTTPGQGPYSFSESTTLALSSYALLLLLALLLVCVPLNGFRVSRTLGYVFLAVYATVMGANVYLEMHGGA